MRGDVTSVQLAGGIAGASWGRIFQCRNDGNVHVEQVDREYRETLISAGICASNGGRDRQLPECRGGDRDPKISGL